MKKNLDSEKRLNIQRLLKPLLWDYTINPVSWYEFMVSGKSDELMPINYDASILRVLERMAWYDIVSLFGLSMIKKKLTKQIIGKLRDPLLKEHYEFVRQLLHKRPLSTSGWRPEYRQRIRATLLSDRRYRLEQRVL